MRVTALLAGLIVCSSLLFADDRTVDFDQQVDFSKIKTFNIRRGEVTSQKPELNNPLFAKKLGEAIRAELLAKGLKETADRPDVYVDYSIAGLDYSLVVNRPASRGPDGPNGRPGVVIQGAGPQPVRFTEGTLTVEMNIREPGTLIWRGQYRDEERNGSKLAQKLPVDAKKLLSDYPPKKKK